MKKSPVEHSCQFSIAFGMRPRSVNYLVQNPRLQKHKYYHRVSTHHRLVEMRYDKDIKASAIPTFTLTINFKIHRTKMFQWLQDATSTRRYHGSGVCYDLNLPYVLDEWLINNAKQYDICQRNGVNNIVNCTYIKLIWGIFSICFDEYGQFGLRRKSPILKMFAHIW